MGARQPPYCEEEFAQRVQQIYEKQVRAQVKERNSGRIVAIDIETEEFEMEDDTLPASGPPVAGCPDTQPWLVRIDRRAAHWFGYSRVRNANWSNLADLAILALGRNRLSGEVSPELGRLASLRRLWVRGNRLIGPIPPTFLELGRLRTFHFFDNPGLCSPSTRQFANRPARIDSRGPRWRRTDEGGE